MRYKYLAVSYHTRLIIFFLLLFVALAFAASPLAYSQHRDDFQEGIAYAGWWHDAYELAESDASLEQLAATGAAWVELVVWCFQKDKSAVSVYKDLKKTPSDRSVAHAIEKIHSLGLKVMLKPYVDSEDGVWRGEFKPSDRDAWFASYSELMLGYAEMARDQKVEQFSVGCEYNFISRDGARWRDLIWKIRSVYEGPLVYCANYDEYRAVAFWDALDYIGIDAYFELAWSDVVDYEDIKHAWRQHIDEIGAWRTGIGKPIIFTEIGYCSQDGAAAKPFSWQISEKVDLREQVELYRAALESLWEVPWMAGMYWWAWEPRPDGGGMNDRGYSPQGKPALDILKAWYSQ